ncbi:MAG: DUF975 family protein [Clostridiales bacterium]|jgi:uncharacterized membrane protein|nr:DUF975 family protein [Clostridiales bacterium]
MINVPVSTFRARAREDLKGRWGSAIGALVLFVISGVVINFICTFVANIFGGQENLVGLFVLQLLTFLLSVPIAFGFIMFMLNFARKDKDVAATDIYNGYNYFVPVVVLNILLNIFILLWTMLLIIPGIIKSIEYSQAQFILADDPTIAPIEAINESKKMMYGNKMKYFLLNLSFIGWGILTVITFGIAAIWVGPYMQTALAEFYLEVSGKGGAEASGDATSSSSAIANSVIVEDKKAPVEPVVKADSEAEKGAEVTSDDE